MDTSAQDRLDRFIVEFKRRNPGQPNFHWVVYEVAADIIPFMQGQPEYQEALILERLTEPDRIISFRVCWEDDRGQVRVNRGYRVQHNNAIGPYKGGIRFSREVGLDILKSLAFEQTFKNSLTGLPMGGAKGGSNFNPKGKSPREVMRFCQAFMTELWRHIGPDTDVPAGDIGVGPREISYMFGQYKRMANRFTGVLTGKGLAFGGSLIRTEATGYGCVYFLQEMLKLKGRELAGMTALVSGAGNVAQHTAEKLMAEGAKVLTFSDSTGFVFDPQGLDAEKLAMLKELKNERRGGLEEYARHFGLEFFADDRPWRVPAQLAAPCATQNEISGDDARRLVNNGCSAVVEGANVPSSREAVEVFRQAGVLFAPSKAANAGGVAVSGLEITQNSMRLSWSRGELERRLRDIMVSIHQQCVQHGREGQEINYSKGANIAAFIKVGDAMLACGVV